jgi:uncharacterized protein YoxC
MTDQELLNLKKSIDNAKRQQSEMEGKKKALVETLNQKFGCKTIDQAEKKVESLSKEIDKLEKEKQELIEKLEKDYEF